MQTDDLVQALRIARGRVMDEPTRTILTLAAERLEEQAQPEPRNNEEALAWALPQQVAAQFEHVLFRMPYGAGLGTQLVRGPWTVGAVVNQLGALVGRLEAQRDAHDDQARELLDLRRQRAAVRDFLGLSTKEDDR